MTAGPTNRTAVEAPLANDPKELILSQVREQGCICDELIIIEHPPTEDMVEVARERGAARITSWEVQHDPSCPLLRLSQGLN